MAITEHERPLQSGGGSLVTTCGRRLSVRCLRLAPADRPIGRVTLDVGRDRGGEPGVWAALTADEARELARLLLQHADLAERGTEPAPDTRPPAP
ncbi:hypothetical protein [Streptomyces sp. 11x1]|uniref:hypothetical protein n=1 Tax=Streptomyces sp. 11x1 TaxID=3038642 RepID=UPI0029312C19|nr:hypothetical protein [Streptomyces sp. 11x1]WNZ06606.1 hypothetical protein P8T65_02715 [Streptomyces sp. 11x1]